MRIKMILILYLFVLPVFFMFPKVENQDKPSKGLWDFKMVKKWEIENIGETPIGSIQNVKIGEDNRVYLIDRKNYKIGIYNNTGKLLKAFGRQGEGPGEIKRFFGGNQLHLTKKSLIIMDRSRIHYFDLEGEYKKTIIIPSNLEVRNIISDTLYISAPTSVRDPKKKEAEILLYNTESKNRQVIAKFNPFSKASDTKASGANITTVAIVIGDITPMMVLGYSNNTLYYCMNNTYQINSYNLITKRTDSFSVLNRKPKLVSKKIKNELKKQLNDVPAEMLKNIINSLPKHASYFYRIYTASGNKNIFLLISDPDSKNSKQIDIFNRNGEFIYSAFITIEKESEINLITFKNNSLYLAVLDEEGNEKLVKYAINLPE